MNSNIVSIDIEVTGISAEDDEIVRLTAVKWAANGESVEFDTWVKPTKPIPKHLKKFIKFKHKWLKNAPALSVALKKFDEFIEDLPLISHNIDFDANFLKEAYAQTLDKAFEKETICTLELARKWSEANPHNKPKSCQLNSLAEFHLGKNRKTFPATPLQICYITEMLYEKLIK